MMRERSMLRDCAALLPILVGACARESQPLPGGHFAAWNRAGSEVRYEQALERAASEPGALRTRSGLIYREIKPGIGPATSKEQTVTVRFQGKTADGTVVDDSAAYGGELTVHLDQLRTCEREVLERMRVGGTSRFVCPLDRDREKERVNQPAVPVFVEVTLLDVGRPPPQHGH
jgi:FKBP-type peptidyl-prolyl cis-trans isomerase